MPLRVFDGIYLLAARCIVARHTRLLKDTIGHGARAFSLPGMAARRKPRWVWTPIESGKNSQEKNMSNWLRSIGSRSLDPPRQCEIRLRPVGNIGAREGRKAAAHSVAKHIFIHACVDVRLIWWGGRAKT